MVRAMQAVVPPFQLSSALDMATISWSHRWKERRRARLMASWSKAGPRFTAARYPASAHDPETCYHGSRLQELVTLGVQTRWKYKVEGCIAG